MFFRLFSNLKVLSNFGYSYPLAVYLDGASLFLSRFPIRCPNSELTLQALFWTPPRRAPKDATYTKGITKGMTPNKRKTHTKRMPPHHPRL